MEALTDVIPSSLLPCLALPFVELFPNLGLSWWTPPNLKLEQYVANGMLRVLLQILAWYPVFEALFPICTSTGDTNTFSLLVIFVAAAIVGRYFVMKKQIKRVTDIQLWNSNIPFEKRQALFTAVTYSKPTNINDFERLCVRYEAMPSKILGVVACMISNVLHNKLDNEDDKTKVLGILAMIVMSGIGINGTRHGNIGLDVVFRCVFGLGYCGLIYHLGKVSDMTLIESIN